MPDAGPLDVIRHLMEAHSLRQKDLVDVFGTESIVSDVLNGKRDHTTQWTNSGTSATSCVIEFMARPERFELPTF